MGAKEFFWNEMIGKISNATKIAFRQEWQAEFVYWLPGGSFIVDG